MRGPQELIVELSHNCNLACTMCGFGGRAIVPERFMGRESFTRILDSLVEQPRTLRLNGRGESTIHPDFVEILEIVRQRLPQTGIQLFTNLSVARGRVVDALVAAEVQVFVSLDSPDPARLEAIRRGCRFPTVSANLERLAASPVRPFAVFTLQEDNFDDVVPMARFSLSRRMHLLVNVVRRDEGIEPFRRLVESRQVELRAAFEEAQGLYAGSSLRCALPDQVQGVPMGAGRAVMTYGSRRSCPAIERELCVLHDGTVTPCNMFNPYVYGNLFRETMEDIRSGPAFRWFSENHKTHHYCAHCACLGEMP